MNDPDGSLSIIIAGASGDLARKKLLPALFALYCQNLLPEHFRVFGFARSRFTREEFRQHTARHLTCRYAPGDHCAERMREFLARCFYVRGRYDSAGSFLDLFQTMQKAETTREPNRLFYLAIPPSLYLGAARAIGAAGLVNCSRARPWSRVVLEKPFGEDRASSDLLAREMAQVFSEHQTYRIDHYLGKELVQNLMVLRFANRVFEPLWNRSHIASARITWKEDAGVEKRGGYFDQYGIIRDVIQNHLTQILALAAMEQPQGPGANHIREAKIRVLRAIPPLEKEDAVLGQYQRGNGRPAYTEEESVPRGSLTPTFAAAVLRVGTDRWRGVPFIISAGKALDTRENQLVLRFREVPGSFFGGSKRLPPNELVIQVQPDEAIRLKIISKVPGLRLDWAEEQLNLRYSEAFPRNIPDAYERLLLDVIQGDKSLFPGADELAAAWDIFTPLLRQIEAEKTRPLPYPFGSPGPAIRSLIRKSES